MASKNCRSVNYYGGGGEEKEVSLIVCFWLEATNEQGERLSIES